MQASQCLPQLGQLFPYRPERAALKLPCCWNNSVKFDFNYGVEAKQEIEHLVNLVNEKQKCIFCDFRKSTCKQCPTSARNSSLVWFTLTKKQDLKTKKQTEIQAFSHNYLITQTFTSCNQSKSVNIPPPSISEPCQLCPSSPGMIQYLLRSWISKTAL